MSVNVTDYRRGKKRMSTIASTYRLANYKGRRFQKQSVVTTPFVTRTGARTAKKVTNMLSSTIGSHSIETKTVDIVLTGSTFNPVPATYVDNTGAKLLNQVREGAADYNRTGKRINMKSIRLRGEVEITSVGPTGTGGSINTLSCRMVLVYFREFHDAIPDWNAVFNQTGPDGVKISNLFSPLAPENMGSVAVLMDKTYTNMPAQVSYWSGAIYSANVPFDEYIDLGGISTTYNGTANPITMANVASGALVLYMRSNFNNNATSEGICAVYENSAARLRYTEM